MWDVGEWHTCPLWICVWIEENEFNHLVMCQVSYWYYRCSANGKNGKDILTDKTMLLIYRKVRYFATSFNHRLLNTLMWCRAWHDELFHMGRLIKWSIVTFAMGPFMLPRDMIKHPHPHILQLNKSLRRKTFVMWQKCSSTIRRKQGSNHLSRKILISTWIVVLSKWCQQRETTLPWCTVLSCEITLLTLHISQCSAFWQIYQNWLTMSLSHTRMMEWPFTIPACEAKKEKWQLKRICFHCYPLSKDSNIYL